MARLIALLMLALLAFAAPQTSAQEKQSAAEISAETPDDPGFLTRFLQQNLSGAGRTVSITGFRGALSSRATFERISIADDEGVWITLHDGAIQWNRSALFGRRIEIDELSAARIELPRLPQGGAREPRAEAREFALPELPVSVEIRRIAAGRVEIGQPVVGEAAVVSVDGGLSLKGGEGAARLAIERIDGKRGIFAVDAGFANATRHLRVDVTLDEAADGILANLVGIEGRPALTATIKGEGALSDFAADVSLATDGTPRVTGRVSAAARAGEDGTPGTGFRLRLGGDVASLLPPAQRPFFGAQAQLLAEGWRGEDGRIALPVLLVDTEALNLSGALATTAAGAPASATLLLTLGEDAGAATLPVRLPTTGEPTTVRTGRLQFGYDAAKGDGWTLKGFLGGFAQEGLALDAVTIDGDGRVVLAEGKLTEVLGRVRFDASGVAPADPGLAQALGPTLAGETSFDWTPGNAVDLTGLTLDGADYLLSGDLRVDGLSSGITVSGRLDGAYEDLSRLATLTGRPLKGRAEVVVEGLLTLLGRAFDAEMQLTGTDVAIGQPQLDRLLAGGSTITASARRDAEGITLRAVTVEAARLTGRASGTITSAGSDVNATLRLASLADVDPALSGGLEAEARLTGAAGDRRVTLNGRAMDLLTGVAQLDAALKGSTGVEATVIEAGSSGWRLQDFRLANAQLTASGEGDLTPGAMDMTLRFAVPQIGAIQPGWQGSLTGNGRVADAPEGRRISLEGSTQGLRIGQADADALLAGTTTFAVEGVQKGATLALERAEIAAPQARATATGTIAAAGTALTATAEIDTLAALGRGWSGRLALQGDLAQDAAGQRRFDVTGTGEDLRLGQARADQALTGTTTIALRGTQSGDAVTLEQARIANPQAEITASGRLARTGTDLTGTARVAALESLGLGMSGGLELAGRVTDSGGGLRRFDLTGTGQNLKLGQAQADAALTGRTEIVLKGSQGPQGIAIEQGRIANEQVQIAAQGTIGSAGTDFTGTAKVGALESLGLGWTGSLDLSGSFRDDGTGARRLAVAGTGENLALGQQQVDGALSGTTRLDLRAVERDGVFTIEAAELANDHARAAVTGTVGRGRTDAAAHVELRRLEALGLGWRGSVVADGTVSDDGSGARRFAVTGTARDLNLGQAQVDAALSGPTDFTLAGVERGGVVTLERAVVDNARLAADVTGTVGGGETALAGRLRADSLAFLGRGLSGGVTAEGSLRQDGRAWVVSATGEGRGLGIGNGRADALLAGVTRFELDATAAGEDVTLRRLEASNPQLRLSANGALASGITLDARLADLALLAPGIEGPATAAGTVRRQGDRLGLDLALTGPGGTTGTVAGSVAQDFSTADLAIRGRSDAAIANPLLRVRSIEGPVDFDLRLNGPPSLESLRGRVSLPSARFSDPKLGVRIEDLRLTADLQGDSVVVDGGGALADGGTLAVSGRVALAQGGVLDLDVRLQEAALRDPNLYETTVTGTLHVSGVPAEGPLIAGALALGRTEIRIPSTGLGGAKDIPKIVHLNERPPSRSTRARAGLTPFPGAEAREAGLAGPPATPPRVAARLDITLSAPSQVFIRGRGVDAEMGGSIRLTGTARKVVPIGMLQLIRGRVDLLGKRFVLSEGILELQGSLIPVIRLVAQTEQDGIVTQITIDGEARDPTITFSSIPDMPQEEVLSQLLFGRGIENISALQAVQLANAVAVLAGRGGEGIVSRLRAGVGLDDLDVGTDEAGNVTMRAGKYLTEKIYTDVEVGGDGKSRVNINLDITDALRARGSVDSEGDSSLGLFYEKDY